MEVGARRTSSLWQGRWYEVKTKILYILDSGNHMKCIDEIRGNIYRVQWVLNREITRSVKRWL